MNKMDNWRAGNQRKSKATTFRINNPMNMTMDRFDGKIIYL